MLGRHGQETATGSARTAVDVNTPHVKAPPLRFDRGRHPAPGAAMGLVTRFGAVADLARTRATQIAVYWPRGPSRPTTNSRPCRGA
jgi:hypothetical protein